MTTTQRPSVEELEQAFAGVNAELLRRGYPQEVITRALRRYGVLKFYMNWIKPAVDVLERIISQDDARPFTVIGLLHLASNELHIVTAVPDEIPVSGVDPYADRSDYRRWIEVIWAADAGEATRLAHEQFDANRPA